MKYCSSCGKEIPESAQYCVDCAAEIESENAESKKKKFGNILSAISILLAGTFAMLLNTDFSSSFHVACLVILAISAIMIAIVATIKYPKSFASTLVFIYGAFLLLYVLIYFSQN